MTRALMLFAAVAALFWIGCALADAWRKPRLLEGRLARAIREHGARSPEARDALAALENYKRGMVG